MTATYMCSNFVVSVVVPPSSATILAKIMSSTDIDDVILRSWENISGILGPWFIVVIKKNRIASKAL